MSCFGLLDFFLFSPFVFISVFRVYALCGCRGKPRVVEIWLYYDKD